MNQNVIELVKGILANPNTIVTENGRGLDVLIKSPFKGESSVSMKLESLIKKVEHELGV